MNLSEFNLINETFETDIVSPIQLDFLLAEGWRHFGKHFFRYNVGMDKNGLQFVMPLRIRVADFVPSKSQRRVLRKNENFGLIRQPVTIEPDTHRLFEKHAARFDYGKPESIYNFLDKDAGRVPCETVEFCVFEREKLVAVSYLDVGEFSVSSIYAMFDPEYSQYSLGIYSMLLEIKFARSLGVTYYYQGYAYEGKSFYDYKKRFSATETFDWNGNWSEIHR